MSRYLSLLESRLSRCLRQPAAFGSPLFQMHQLHFAVTGCYNSASLLLVGPLHISYPIGQVSMVEERGRQVVELPLPLSHSTKLRYTLFQTASSISRHRLQKLKDVWMLANCLQLIGIHSRLPKEHSDCIPLQCRS
jgi:hypothetical protein